MLENGKDGKEQTGYLLLHDQGCVGEYLQLSVLHDIGDYIGSTIPMVFREFPSQKLAFFGMAILEDRNQKSLPLLQIPLPPVPATRFVPYFIEFVKRK